MECWRRELQGFLLIKRQTGQQGNNHNNRHIGLKDILRANPGQG